MERRGAYSVGPDTKMGNITKKLHAVLLLGQRISQWVTSTHNLHLSGQHFNNLALARAFNNVALNQNGCASGAFGCFELLEAYFVLIYNYLQTLKVRTVVDVDEGQLAPGTKSDGFNPTGNNDGSVNEPGALVLTAQNLFHGQPARELVARC